VIVSADELAVLVEVVVEGGVDGAELSQSLDLPEAEHGPFSSSDGQVQVFGPDIRPAPGSVKR